MWVSRRAFQKFFLMGTAYHALPIKVFSSVPAWEDLAQPFTAQVRRLLAALEWIGEPFEPTEATAVNAVLAKAPQKDTIERLDEILKRHALIHVDINPESRVSASRGAAKAQLVEDGWRSFLVRVNNQARDTSVLQFRSPQGGRMGRVSGSEIEATQDFTIGGVDAVEAQNRWIALNSWDKSPLQPALSGLELEYRILQIYSRDHGRREASIEAVTGGGVQDLGYRSTVAILFDCVPAHLVKLRIVDGPGVATVASLLITDKLGRVYPTQSKRALPDLWFQPHIYRGDGETISLPDGLYSIDFGRGPEYLRKTLAIEVRGSILNDLNLPLERWIQPGRFGYYSGDSHIHAAGCSHYESPSEGVPPEVMLRQTEGEALDVGSVLTWAPGFRYQSQFFTGHVHHFERTSRNTESGKDGKEPGVKPSLRYDIEVSGFPSSHCGHLVLLKLKEQIYPGTSKLEDWPSWNLPILKWAKSQGAITGYAHSGWGMVVDSTEVPNTLMPRFDSCGANEYLVDVTHEGMLDFISGCDLWPFVELNIWYHVLNCGYRLQFAGETDFPCITDKCVGGGRSYVRLQAPPIGDPGYDKWLVDGLQRGHSYFGDGRSHIFGFAAEGASRAEGGDELRSSKPISMQVTARVCARLEPEITVATEKIRKASQYDQPYWHVERARIGSSRKVPVELIVNGVSVQRQEIEADGHVYDVSFDLALAKSSWIALRIYPSAHTNPLFVSMGERPLRASKQSAQWCRRALDVCWEQKAPRIRSTELLEAKSAYEHARLAYERIISESLA